MIKSSIKILVTLILISAIKLLSQTDVSSASTSEYKFIKGVDVSTLLEIEENGGVYRENGIVNDPIQMFKAHDINFIRLKIWHTSANGYNNLEKVLFAAQRIKNAGLKFLLDIHYSDTWADPANQIKPVAWSGLSFQSLNDSVYTYTKNIITTLKNHNVLPDIVQIGNEIICGMLWDDGRICESYNTPQQWANFAKLVNEGIRGVKESLQSNDSVKIMIHIDRGGDNNGSRWFFDGLLAQAVDFDIIGLSYYPWWHGPISDLQSNLSDLVQRYNKEIIIVETAYPWTLDWYDNTNNIVGNANQLLPGYPATVQGQKEYLSDLMNLVNNLPNNKGLGFFYWEPEWISTQTFGSPWENLTLFDFTGNLLSSISAFDSTVTDILIHTTTAYSFQLYQNYPNPFNPSTTINYDLPEAANVKLIIYNILGQEVKTLLNAFKEAGVHTVNFNASELNSGLYIYKIEAGSFTQTRKMTLIK